MRKIFHILIFVIVASCFVFGMTSCTEKTKVLRDLEQLSKEVLENGANYDVLTWKDVFVQYRSINSVIDMHYSEYSQRDRNRIMKARSDIKRTAKDALVDKVESIPYIKELFYMLICS